MGRDETKHYSKHKRSHDTTDDHEHRNKKRHKDREDGSSSNKRKKEKRSKEEARIVDEDMNGEDMWVEKNIDLEGEIVSCSRVLRVLYPFTQSLYGSLSQRTYPQQKV